MVNSFAANPIGSVSQDFTPSIGGSFGSPRIVKSDLAVAADAFGSLARTGLAISDQIADSRATSEAERIKTESENLVLTPLENSQATQVATDIGKRQNQVTQGKNTFERVNQHMRKELAKLSPTVRAAATAKLRQMGIEDPSQALLRQKISNEQNANAVALERENASIATAVASGNGDIYNIPDDPNSGINRPVAISVGNQRNFKLAQTALLLENQGLNNTGGGGGTGGGTATSGIRPAVATSIDRTMATHRGALMNNQVDLAFEDTFNQMASLNRQLLNPSKSLTNQDIADMSLVLEQTKSRLKADMFSNFTASGSFNNAELLEADAQVDALFSEFIFNGDEERAKNFESTLIAQGAIAARNGGILSEQMPLLAAFNKIDPGLAKTLVAKDFTKMLGNMDDAANVIKQLGSEGINLTDASSSTKRLIAKGIIKWTADTAKVSASEETTTTANTRMNGWELVSDASSGKLPDPVKNKDLMLLMTSPKNVSTLLNAAAKSETTNDQEVLRYHYDSAMNAVEFETRRLKEKPGFNETFQVKIVGGQATLIETPAEITDDPFMLQQSVATAPNVFREVRKQIKDINQYLRAAESFAPIAEVDHPMFSEAIAASLAGALAVAPVAPAAAPVDPAPVASPVVPVVSNDITPSTKVAVTPEVISALSAIESSDNPEAVSDKGALGLFQIMPETASNPGLGVESIDMTTATEAEQRIFANNYLSALVERYGNLEFALAAYNWGLGNVDAWIRDGADRTALPKETSDYLTKFRGKGVL